MTTIVTAVCRVFIGRVVGSTWVGTRVARRCVYAGRAGLWKMAGWTYLGWKAVSIQDETAWVNRVERCQFGSTYGRRVSV